MENLLERVLTGLAQNVPESREKAIQALPVRGAALCLVRALADRESIERLIVYRVDRQSSVELAVECIAMTMFSKPKPSSSKGEKRKHVTLTLNQKLEIIKRLEKGENRNVLMNEFNIGSSTIYDIKKQKDELMKFASQSVTTEKLASRKTLKKPKLEQLDSVLFKWFSAVRSEGKPVTGPMIVEKAKKFGQDLGVAESECNYSDGWLRNFKFRHGIRRLDVTGETLSANQNSAEKYKDEFEKIVADNDLTPEQIYNADETGLLWRCLPTSTLAGGGEKAAKGFKKNKDRLTVLLCANASGNHRVTPFVIGKSAKPRAFKNVTHLPVQYDAQSNAWITAALFKDWFFHHFVPEVKESFKSLGLPEDTKAILLLDNCKAHPPVDELVSGNIVATLLPPNVTSLIQPMDQGVIQNFKCFYRRSFIQGLLNADCDVTDFQKKFTVKDAVYAIAQSWNQVKNTTLQKCWRKLWPAANPASDLTLQTDEEENHQDALTKVLDVVRSTDNPLKNLPEDEVEEWLLIDENEPVEQELTDEDIINIVVNPQPTQNLEENDSDAETEEKEKISWAEAAESLNKFISFAEASTSYSASEIIDFHIIRNKFYTKRQKSRKQKDILLFNNKQITVPNQDFLKESLLG
ncbi:Jerky protein, partial [Stegodyphus mimosarum]